MRRPRASEQLLPLAGLLLSLTAALDARAACSQSVQFGQLAPNCAGSYCYVQSPGSATASTLTASFWSFAAGAPANGPGIDNGSWPDGSWLFGAAGGHWMSGDWSSSASIDGCIAGSIAPGKPAEIMVALFGDAGSNTSYFAAASARRVPAESPQIDFTFANGGGTPKNIVLAEIPRLASVTARAGGSYDVRGPSASSVAPGIFGDGTLQNGEVVVGFRVYTTSHAPASLRRDDGWTSVSGVVPLGQVVTLSLPCPASGTIYMTHALVLDSGFEAAYVAPRPFQIVCNSCPAETQDKDGDGWLDRFGNPECCPDPDVCDCDDSNPAVHPGAIEVCDGKDDDCNHTVDEVSGLRVGKGAGVTTLDWDALTGTPGYDVQRGDLGTLVATGGDFSAATQACAAAGLLVTHAEDATPLPPGDGTWYLVRSKGCPGAGTYDDPLESRRGSRDPGIAASGEACP